MPGNAGDFLTNRAWIWAPALYIAGLLLMNLLSIPLAPDGMPDDCPENAGNCERRQIMLDVSDEELHEAMEEWVDTRIFTATFSECGNSGRCAVRLLASYRRFRARSASIS